MRVLLTGADGQVGRELARRLAGDGWDVLAATRAALDLAAPRAIEDLFARHAFDLAINAAAFTAVDQAESDEAGAFAINAEAPGRLARACARTGAALVHLSTDYVFDGTKPGPYVEDDPVAPINAYGRSKAAGESAVRAALDRHLIVRTAWVFSARGRNFVKTMLRLAAERDELAVVDDQIGNPTAAGDLAAAVLELVGAAQARGEGFSWGVHHCVNADAVSWRGFAEAIVAQAAERLGRRPRVRAITTAELPTPAARPANSRLDAGKLARAIGRAMPSWRDALPAVIDDILDGAHTTAETAQ